MKKIIKIELAADETRYINPSYVKEVKTSESKYEHGICVTLTLQDDNIIPILYKNKADAETFVSYILECMESS